MPLAQPTSSYATDTFVLPGRRWAPLVSQADAEAGTGTVITSWTPERVAQAIAALAAGGGGGGATRQTAANSTGDTTLTAIAADIIQHTAVVTITGSARTSAIAIPITNRTAGDRAAVKLILPATAAIIINITNSTTGGTTLYSLTTDTSGDDACYEVEYDGAAWQPLRYNYPI